TEEELISQKLVMPAHSRSKNGVASLAYVAGIPFLSLRGVRRTPKQSRPGDAEISLRSQ
ncbi:MAG: hypothetical protein QOG74_2054, partial [Alphaproteobacteria bacterium]|nr:hypothetical protein [Alphaproteobacteria bacterium]